MTAHHGKAHKPAALPGLARAQWLEDRQAELLDAPYFHVVFTVPDEIAVIAFQNQVVVYDILFRAVSETLTRIAADPQASGCGDRLSGRAAHLGAEPDAPPASALPGPGWRYRTGWPELDRLQTRVLSAGQGAVTDVPGIGGLFLNYLEKAFTVGQLKFFTEHRHLQEPAAFHRYLAPTYHVEWVVYAKSPFAGPAQVLEYVGRYTHRVAISNNRLVSIEDGKIRFRWKDYRQENSQKVMTLDSGEFIRRFLIHVLPDGFHRIRYYGFLSNCHRSRKLAQCRATARDGVSRTIGS
jgi:Putative transposase